MTTEAAAEPIETSEPRITAQPFPARTSDSIWGRAGTLRDELYDAVEKACEELGIDALILKSPHFSFPAWVTLSAWLPKGDGFSERVYLEISIEPRPHFKHEFVFKITRKRGRKTVVDDRLVRIGPAEAGKWARYVLTGKVKPRLGPHKLRRFAHQIWRPKNKLSDMRIDWAAVSVGILFCAGVGAFVLVDSGNVGEEFGAGGILIPISILVGLLLKRRKKLAFNAGKPNEEPRNMRLVDNWQVLILNLAEAESELRKRLQESLSEGSTLNIRLRGEDIAYIGVDGKQEREQLVLSLGRGLLFCHVYQFGKDIYVGWDAHVNYGEWVESQIASGKHKQGLADINTVVPGFHDVTEYDLIEVSCLIEWVHARVQQVIKRLMDEKQIDQEIDFTVMRGNRQNLISQGGQKTQQTGRAGKRRLGGLLPGGALRRRA